MEAPREVKSLSEWVMNVKDNWGKEKEDVIWKERNTVGSEGDR